MKKYKVLSINCEGVNLECYFDITTNNNPYTLYRKWYEVTDNGLKRHKNKLVSYQNFTSVLAYIMDFANNTHWGYKDCFPIAEIEQG